MSTTTVFFLSDNKIDSVDFKNAFRGAMYVWNDIAKRYCGFNTFPAFSKDDQMKVWNFGNNHPEKIPRNESIVMSSTMDGALLEPLKWLELVEAFEAYAKDHKNSSIGEQSSAIRTVMESDKAEAITAIGWRQTSVCGDCLWSPWDEESEDYGIYCPESGSDHFWIMESIDETYQDEIMKTAC